MARSNKVIRQGEGAAEVKLPAGAETVVAEVTGITTEPANGQVEVQAEVPFTSPAESTEQTVRIRRNGVAGTEISKTTVKEGASKNCTVSVMVQDAPGEVANMTYVVTLQDVAGKESIAKKAQIQAIF